MKTDNIPLPSSGGKTLDKSGVKATGYIDKKGTPNGESAKFNAMPPGQDIDDQKLADIHEMPLKTVVSLGYPGDGWT